MQTMTRPKHLSSQAEPTTAPDEVSGPSIRRDQLEAVRRSVRQALPINILLGVASFAVSVHAGNGRAGLCWLAASTAVNLGRAAVCSAPCVGLPSAATGPAATRSVDLHLRVGCLGAFVSGLVWALLPLLCDGFTTPQTLFYLTITCGITAGAVTYGTAFAPIPICFIMPPLASAATCLFATGAFDRSCLGLTVVLYLAGLIRGTLAAERVFRDTSRSRNEARSAAATRETARAEASALAAEMERRATRDDLTDLLNRAGFAGAVDGAILRDTRHPCLMLLDLDGFKSINDVYGHKMGDRVLVEVARRLRAVLPPTCLAGRLGGDEFAVFFDAANEPEAPTALAERLIGAVRRPFAAFDVGRLGMSIGIDATGHRDLTRMLSCADEALYAAKHGGRNRCHVFDGVLRRRLEMRRDVKRDLAAALADDAVEVWFQPIFGQGGRGLSGFEALVRWHHPTHGWIPPADLIALAGMGGLTETLFRAILGQVCKTLRTLLDAGRTDLRVAVNVSPREMAQVPVDDIILEMLRQHGLPTSMLEVEITEETATDIEAVRGRLKRLHGAGVGIALDDFGAGYSSLALLQELRAQRFKIDRSLVQGIAADEGKRRLVEAVMVLGRLLRIEVVAGGIETDEDLASLRAAKCQFMQGYLLGRPTPIRDALALATTPMAYVA